jgi:hypothetical protein
VEAAISARSEAGVVPEEDRQRYRECFRRVVRGWNWLGDNPRRFAIGVLVLLGRPELFFAFILLPMNLVCGAAWLWQRSANRRFLAVGVSVPGR